jgi:hypothetical protein
VAPASLLSKPPGRADCLGIVISSCWTLQLSSADADTRAEIYVGRWCGNFGAMADTQWDSMPNAGSASATIQDLDPWLLSVMRKERNRAALVSLEKMLHEFVAKSAEQQFVFPPKGRFYRKVCHAVAGWYKLDHRLEQAPNAAVDELQLILIKTPLTAVPAFSLAELVASAAVSSTSGVNPALPAATAAPEHSVVSGDSHSPASSVQTKSVAPPPSSAFAPRTAKEIADQPDPAHCRLHSDSVAGKVPCVAGDSVPVLDKRLPDVEAVIVLEPGRFSTAAETVQEDVLSLDPCLRPAVLRRPVDASTRQSWRNSSCTGDGSTGSGTAGVKNVTQEEYER